MHMTQYWFLGIQSSSLTVQINRNISFYTWSISYTLFLFEYWAIILSSWIRIFICIVSSLTPNQEVNSLLDFFLFLSHILSAHVHFDSSNNLSSCVKICHNRTMATKLMLCASELNPNQWDSYKVKSLT